MKNHSILKYDDFVNESFGDTKLVLFEPIKNHGSYNTIHIEVYYEKGFYSFGQRKEIERGVWVRVEPMEKSGDREIYTLIGSPEHPTIDVCAMELGRMSQTRMNSVYEKVKEISSEIAKLYDEKKFTEIEIILKSL